MNLRTPLWPEGRLNLTTPLNLLLVAACVLGGGWFYLRARRHLRRLGAGIPFTDWWRLRGTYTYTHVSVEDPGPLGLTGLPSWEDTQPANQLSLTTSFDLPGNVQFDGLLRYVDGLNVPGLASHFTLDLRLAWQATKNIELAIVGQNLIERHHAEFAPLFTTFPATEVPRSVYGKITFKF